MPGPPDREWSTDEVDLVTNSVCERCNNGWLHNLETEARTLLTRLTPWHGDGPLVSGAKNGRNLELQDRFCSYQLLRWRRTNVPIPAKIRFHGHLRASSDHPRKHVSGLGPREATIQSNETSTEDNMVNVQT